jgi:hypothetical protein
MHVYYAKEVLMTSEEMKQYLFNKLNQVKNPTPRNLYGAGWDVLFALKMNMNGRGQPTFEAWLEEWRDGGR